MKLAQDSFSAINTLVVGDVMLDQYWFGNVDRISPEAPVPVLAVKKQEMRAGGAANVAHNLLALGAKTNLLSVVGDDEAGREIKSIVEGNGAQTNLITDSSIKTIVKLRMVAQNQQLLRADFDFQPSDETLAQCLSDFEQQLSSANVVLLSDYGKGGLRHVSQMIALARGHNLPVVIDPKGSDYSRYRGATLITPNMKEFEAVAGKSESEADFSAKGHALLKELELEYLLVTRSEKGMSLFCQDGQQINSPAKAIEVYDVSGAGDTVIAIIALALVSKLTVEEKLELANTAAGIVVGKLGTATASIDEVIAKFNQE